MILRVPTQLKASSLLKLYWGSLDLSLHGSYGPSSVAKAEVSSYFLRSLSRHVITHEPNLLIEKGVWSIPPSKYTQGTGRLSLRVAGGSRYISRNMISAGNLCSLNGSLGGMAAREIEVPPATRAEKNLTKQAFWAPFVPGRRPSMEDLDPFANCAGASIITNVEVPYRYSYILSTSF